MADLKVFYEGNFSTVAVHEKSGSRIETSYPTFSPIDLFASSIGACVLTVMSLTAQRLGVDLGKASIDVEKEMTRSLPRRVASLKLHFTSDVSLSPEHSLALEKAGVDCPLHHTLHPEVQVEFHFQWGAS